MILIGLLLVVPGIVSPVFSQIFIDDILLGGNNDWMTTLLSIMLGTFTFKAVLTYYRSMLLQKVQNKLILFSAYRFLTHLFRLPISFFDQRSAGDISKRVENNNNISTFLTSSLAETALNILVALFYLILLLFYSPLLTAIGLVSVTVNLFVMYRSSKAIQDFSMKSQQDQGKLAGSLLVGLTIYQMPVTLPAVLCVTEYRTGTFFGGGVILVAGRRGCGSEKCKPQRWRNIVLSIFE